jgi:hypothetical protein
VMGLGATLSVGKGLEYGSISKTAAAAYRRIWSHSKNCVLPTQAGMHDVSLFHATSSVQPTLLWLDLELRRHGESSMGTHAPSFAIDIVGPRPNRHGQRGKARCALSYFWVVRKRVRRPFLFFNSCTENVHVSLHIV